MSDILAKAGERLAAEKKRKECTHTHLRFGRQGFDLTCIDCGRRYVTTMAGYDVPEFTYSNVKIGNNDTRHSPHEAPRTAPPPKPPEPSAKKRKR